MKLRFVIFLLTEDWIGLGWMLSVSCCQSGFVVCFLQTVPTCDGVVTITALISSISGVDCAGKITHTYNLSHLFLLTSVTQLSLVQFSSVQSLQ